MISSVRDARIGIPHRTDEPLGQVFEPGIRPRGSENSLNRHVPNGLIAELRLCPQSQI
ncbi:hypothetical protein [Mesorhizobium sp. M7A.F.Ca.MR.176.00.0.0]|uniref:hypothetical protein n=1 Tax=Mesorhizobium sp. M7A.F.Ca.MR.176.00.0.0 TaxID=2496776 RepID=UPI0013E40BEF|nr:hypothetical protein [Mesorhizobium sp. M7A.F.Ca.MR.176.00.0.0]